MLRWDKSIERIERESAVGGEDVAADRTSGERNSVVAARAAETRLGRRGPGAALDSSVRESMESSFGSDFSDVRIHEGGAGDARAITRGTDIRFADGEYDPHSQTGRELLGHELAHVVQQRHGRADTGQAKCVVWAGDNALEREADVTGAKAARGLPTGMKASAGPVTQVAVQAKLGPTRDSLGGTQRGKSLVTFARILDRLDQYHASDIGTSVETAPAKKLQALAKLLANIAELTARWLAKNPDGQGAPTITALQNEAHAELDSVRTILNKRETKRKKIMAGVVKANTEDARGKSLSWVGKDGGLQGKSKHPKYIDEDKKVGWRAGDCKNAVDDNDWVTKYHTTDAQKEATRLKAGGSTGKLKRDGKTVNENELGWVMDPKGGNVHGFDVDGADIHDRIMGHTSRTDLGNAVSMFNQDRKRFQLRANHHTTPLAGGDVAGAGAMDVRDGYIKKVTDESGHYTPEGEYTHQAVREMERKKMPLVQRDGEHIESAKVSLTGYDEIRGAGKSWIKDHNDSVGDWSKKMYAGALTLPYQAFLSSYGNEQQMRLKHTLQSAIWNNTTKVPHHQKAKPDQQSGTQTDDDRPYITLDDLHQDQQHGTQTDDDRPYITLDDLHQGQNPDVGGDSLPYVPTSEVFGTQQQNDGGNTGAYVPSSELFGTQFSPQQALGDEKSEEDESSSGGYVDLDLSGGSYSARDWDDDIL